MRWAWSVAGNAIGLAGLEVVDLDGDGRAEILASADPWEAGGYWYELRRNDDGLKQTFSSLPRADSVRGLGVGAEDGDLWIVVAGRASLSVYEAVSKQEIASFPTLSAENLALAVGDIDGDGALDGVVCDESDLFVYDLVTGTGVVKFGFGCQDVDLGQTDSDPQLEVALAGNPLGGFVLDGASLDVQWADVRGFGRLVCLGDFDGDGNDEVASQVHDWGGVRVQDPESGLLLWELLSEEVVALAAGNVDEVPGEELLWGQGQWGSVHVVDGETGLELNAIGNPEHGVTAVAIGDTNDDGIADAVWGAGWTSSGPDILYVGRVDGDSFEARTLDWRGPFPGAAVGDFSGTGILEVATALRASDSYYNDGVGVVLAFHDGRLLRSSSQLIPSSFGLGIDSFSASQLDGDPALEFCVGGGGTVGCYDGATFANQWTVQVPDQTRTQQLGEIDGDAFPEMMVGTEAGFVFALEAESGWLKWRTPEIDPAPGAFDSIRLLDLQGSPLQEVVAGSSQASGGNLTTFAGGTGLVLAGPWDESPFLSTSTLDAPVSPEPFFLAKYDGSIVPFDPIAGEEGSALAVLPEPVYAFRFAEFTGDGVLDVVARLENRFVIQDGQSGLTVWESPYLGYLVGTTESLLVGDLDGNGLSDVLLSTGNGLALFELVAPILFADGFESGDISAWDSSST